MSDFENKGDDNLVSKISFQKILKIVASKVKTQISVSLRTSLDPRIVLLTIGP